MTVNTDNIWLLPKTYCHITIITVHLKGKLLRKTKTVKLDMGAEPSNTLETVSSALVSQLVTHDKGSINNAY